MKPWTRMFFAAVTTLVGAVYLAWKGPVPVVRVFDTLPIDAPLWYMLTAFPVLGLLGADLLALARTRRWSHAIELCIQLALIVALSQGRLELRIPVSGHALLFSCFVLRRAWEFEPRTPHRQLELGLGIGLLAMVCGVKLLWWRDPVTLLVGIATAAAITWIGRWVLTNHTERRGSR